MKTPTHILIVEDMPADADLARRAAEVVGYKGSLIFDATKPDGTPQKLLDVSRLYHLGWRPKTGMDAGIRYAYEDFLGLVEKGHVK